MKIKTAVITIIGLASTLNLHSILRAERPVILPQGPAAPSALRSVWDGVYTEEQAKRGADFYREECSSCHAATLTGIEEAPPLAGPAFLGNWNGLTVGDLFERVRISMPPNKKGRLGREKTADILAHALRVNGFPAGELELEHETERLKQIRIDAIKP